MSHTCLCSSVCTLILICLHCASEQDQRLHITSTSQVGRQQTECLPTNLITVIVRTLNTSGYAMRVSKDNVGTCNLSVKTTLGRCHWNESCGSRRDVSVRMTTLGPVMCLEGLRITSEHVILVYENNNRTCHSRM